MEVFKCKWSLGREEGEKGRQGHLQLSLVIRECKIVDNKEIGNEDNEEEICISINNHNNNRDNNKNNNSHGLVLTLGVYLSCQSKTTNSFFPALTNSSLTIPMCRSTQLCLKIFSMKLSHLCGLEGGNTDELTTHACVA